jgi:hypothetical protein
LHLFLQAFFESFKPSNDDCEEYKCKASNSSLGDMQLKRNAQILLAFWQVTLILAEKIWQNLQRLGLNNLLE